MMHQDINQNGPGGLVIQKSILMFNTWFSSDSRVLEKVNTTQIHIASSQEVADSSTEIIFKVLVTHLKLTNNYTALHCTALIG